MEEHTVLHYMIVYVVIRSQLIYLPMPFFNTSQKPWFPWGCLIIGGWDQWLIMVTGYPAGVRPAKEIFEIKDDTLWIHVCMHTNMHYMIHNWTNYFFDQKNYRVVLYNVVFGDLMRHVWPASYNIWVCLIMNRYIPKFDS